MAGKNNSDTVESTLEHQGKCRCISCGHREPESIPAICKLVEDTQAFQKSAVPEGVWCKAGVVFGGVFRADTGFVVRAPFEDDVYNHAREEKAARDCIRFG